MIGAWSCARRRRASRRARSPPASPPCAPMPGISSGSDGASLAHAGDLGRIGGTDDQAELAAAVPGARGEAGDVVRRRARRTRGAASCRSAPPGLEVRQSRISALAVVAQVGLDRIEAEQRRQRHRVGPVAHEDLARVLLGGRADVAALGVEDHRHVGRDVVDVGDQALELRFGAVRREVGDLRLEGETRSWVAIDDRGAEVEDARRVAAPRAGKARRLGVEADAEQRSVGALGARAGWRRSSSLRFRRRRARPCGCGRARALRRPRPAPAPRPCPM